MENLNTGEKIAGASGVALILIMFIFSWFSVDGIPEGLDSGLNAWDSFDVIDWILLLAALSGIGLALIAATQSEVNLPVAMSSLTAGLGILATILVLYRILVTPDVGSFGIEVDTSRSIGVFLGLIAAAGVAYGGWRAMEDEGAAFSAGAGSGTGGTRGGAPPPPPAQ